MAASELNNRLDYLISYSSQLVFVCSDKIPQQSQVVESFLAHQNEQADLALLTANELTPLVIYREKLFRQLISQNQKADFNRPLNQLLAPLNNHSGPILISVFHAEKLPDRLVKELWDLVLQSRFANNKQHLNVLLMGLSDWAETAKSGLGSRSKEQPIVLNSQIDIQHTETEEFSDLEAFIQDKRKKFAQRIEERHFDNYESKPTYKKWWMTILFGLIFLSVFSGILGWQYPEKVQDILAYSSIQQATPTEQQKTPEVTTKVEPVSVENAEPIVQPTKQLSAATNLPVVKKINIKDELVTDWTSASAKLQKQSNKILLKSNTADVSAAIKTTTPSESLPPTTIAESPLPTKTVNDYQIEDSVALKPVAEMEEFSAKTVAQSQTDEMLRPKPELILALPENNFVIQIAAMANISILQDYVTENQLSQQLWLYKTQRYGGAWYVLLKNQDFTSIQDARAEISHLADSLLMNTPFVKSIAQVKQEITLSRR
ncbi:DamX protein [uncultured Paraglaciecola sp.]|uniref:SPOR domain-containing protein n=1 Tax=uncultured Paraglaciecola sp. TaxID=1765024 RepID=UPI0030D803A0|tara:strand:+ start:149254 stop:150720 length:1467 start_codon:yes stop_codon:yes gene_type:complete